MNKIYIKRAAIVGIIVAVLLILYTLVFRSSDPDKQTILLIVPIMTFFYVAVPLYVIMWIYHFFRTRGMVGALSSIYNAPKKLKYKIVSGIEDDLPHFYAEAENELNNNVIDNPLWSQAFVMAEGNEEKRKAIYIKLRAQKLKNEPQVN